MTTEIDGAKEGRTSVVNIRSEKYDVYIGRAGRGKNGYFGNPFTNGSRQDVIDAYRTYFYERLKNDEAFLKDVISLRGKRLGCFCKPLACHGDVIVEFLQVPGGF